MLENTADLTAHTSYEHRTSLSSLLNWSAVGDGDVDGELVCKVVLGQAAPGERPQHSRREKAGAALDAEQRAHGGCLYDLHFKGDAMASSSESTCATRRVPPSCCRCAKISSATSGGRCCIITGWGFRYLSMPSPSAEGE